MVSTASDSGILAQSSRFIAQPIIRKPVYLELKNGMRILLRDISSNSNHIVYDLDPSTKTSLVVVEETASTAAHSSTGPDGTFLAPDALVRARKAPKPIPFTRWSPFSGTGSPDLEAPRRLPGLGAQGLAEHLSENVTVSLDSSQHIQAPLVAPPADFASVHNLVAQRLVERAKGNEMPLGVRSLPPSGIVPNANKKEFCSHWIRHGECNFTQQGCVYKHIMPDLPKLREIGFRQVPDWYREKELTVNLASLHRRSRPQVLTMDGSRHAPGAGDLARARVSSATLRTLISGTAPTLQQDQASLVNANNVFLKPTTSLPSQQQGGTPSLGSPGTANTLHGQSLIDLDLDDADVAAISSHQTHNGVTTTHLSSGYIHVERPQQTVTPVRTSSANSDESRAQSSNSPARNSPGIIGQPRRVRGGRGHSKTGATKDKKDSDLTRSTTR